MVIANETGILKRPALPQLEFTSTAPESLIEIYEVEKLGGIDGRSLRPSPGSTTLSEVEKRVAAYVGSQERIAQTSYEEVFKRHRARLNDLDQALQPSNITARGSTLKHSLIQFADEAERDFNDRFNLLCLSYRDLDRFKRSNGLDQDAALDDRDAGRKSLLLVIMFIIEMAFNGYYISLHLAGGILEGITIAGTISFLNLSFGFSAGFLCLTNLLHKHTSRKLFALTGLATLLVVAIVLNLGVGHIRAVLSADTLTLVKAAIQAFTRLAEAPFDLGDMSSVVLTFLGLTCAGIAAFSGFRWDEPYPGYALRARSYRSAQQDLTEIVAERGAMLAENHEGAVATLINDRDMLLRSASEYRAVVRGMHDLQVSYQRHIKGLETTLHAVLSAYRDANRASRGPSPEPKYFGEFSELHPISLEDLAATTRPDAELKRIETEAVNRFEEELRGLDHAYQIAKQKLVDCVDVNVQPEALCAGQSVHNDMVQQRAALAAAAAGPGTVGDV